MSVQSSELVPSTPSPTSKRMALPPKDPSEGSHTRLQGKGGGVPIRD